MLVILGPVNSPYPGKYVCFAMMAFLIWHMKIGLAQSLRLRKESLNQKRLGIEVKPDSKKNPMAGIVIALFDVIMLTILISAIYTEWPK
jgi:hypothetical protein